MTAAHHRLRAGSQPLVWTTRRATAKGGQGLRRVQKVAPSAPGSIALGEATGAHTKAKFIRLF